MKLVTGVDSSTRLVRRSGSEGKNVNKLSRRTTANIMISKLRRSMIAVVVGFRVAARVESSERAGGYVAAAVVAARSP